MPWRLVQFIIIFIIFFFLIVFNLNNKCDISIGFHVFKDVHVFVTAFSSFIVGLLCTVPFFFGRSRKKDKAAAKEAKPDKKHDSSDNYSDNGHYGIN